MTGSGTRAEGSAASGGGSVFMVGVQVTNVEINYFSKRISQSQVSYNKRLTRMTDNKNKETTQEVEVQVCVLKLIIIN